MENDSVSASWRVGYKFVHKVDYIKLDL